MSFRSVERSRDSIRRRDIFDGKSINVESLVVEDWLCHLRFFEYEYEYRFTEYEYEEIRCESSHCTNGSVQQGRGDDSTQVKNARSRPSSATVWYARHGHELLGCHPPWTSPLCEIGISRRSVYQMTASREQALGEGNCVRVTKRGKEACECMGKPRVCRLPSERHSPLGCILTKSARLRTETSYKAGPVSL